MATLAAATAHNALLRPADLRVRTIRLLPIYGLILAAWLSACGKLNAPSPGAYRAYVQVRGGEVPFEIQVHTGAPQATLSVMHDDGAHTATNVQVQDGVLHAELPDAAGTLQATLARDSMKGEVRLLDRDGHIQTLPFAADLNKAYRFFTSSSTDNADVTGAWLLEAVAAEHFSAPVSVQLSQHFDAVDGQLRLPDGKILPIVGQVNGEQIYLSTLAQGRAVLLKGKVNERGELVGQLWTNMSDAKNWVAKRVLGEPDALPEGAKDLHPTQLHWAAPPP